MNARYYDPHLGSFITPDPAMSGLNHYAYCSANPIKYTDPTGLRWITTHPFGEKGSVWPGGKHFGTDSVYIIDGVDKTIGAPVYAKEDGVVIRSEWSDKAGNIITTKHIDKNGNEYRRSYQHNSKNLVKVGDKVKAGEKIAEGGNKGNVYPKPTTENPDKGAHLHDDKYYLDKDLAIKAGYNEKDIQEIIWTYKDKDGKEHSLTVFYVPDKPDGSIIDLNTLNNTVKDQIKNEVNNKTPTPSPYSNPIGPTPSPNKISTPPSSSNNNTSGGGISVICTELNRQRLMDNIIYKADSEFGKLIQNKYPYVLKGYHFWAKPVVRLMQKSKIITKIVYHIAKPWAEEMAFKMGYIEKGNVVGKILMAVGIPICGIIGFIISNIRLSIILLFNLIILIFVLKTRKRNKIEGEYLCAD